MKNLLIVALLLSANSALALDRCESAFRRGLSEMKSHFNRMGAACQREVNLGAANEDRIRAVCNANERSDALSMKSIKEGQLRPLCQDPECTRLKERGVCVDGKTFSYYLSKFGM